MNKVNMNKVKLTSICNPKQWKTIPTKQLKETGYPVYGANGVIGYWDEFNHISDTITIGCRGTCGNINIAKGQSYINGNAMCLDDLNDNVNMLYLYYYLQNYNFGKVVSGTSIPQITRQGLEKIELEIPPLATQAAIVAKLDKVSALITARKQQLAKLDELVKARFVEMFGDPETNPKYSGVPLGTICSTLSGGTPTTKVLEYYQGDIPWISTPYLGNNYINGSSAKAYITEDAIKNSATHLIPANTIMFGIRVGVGKSSIIDEPMCANQDIVALMGIDTNKYNLLFVKHTLDSYQSHFDSIKKGATILGITTDDLKKVLVPNVDIDLQNQFAAFVEQTDKSKLAVQKGLDKLETLKKALMQEYFG